MITLRQRIRRRHVINFRPIPFLLIGIIAGIISVTRQDAYIAIGWVFIAMAIYAFAYLFTDIKKNMLVLFATAVILGGLVASLTFYSYQTKLSKGYYEPTVISGRVQSVNEMQNGGLKIILDNLIVENEEIHGAAYLIIGTQDGYNIGQSEYDIGQSGYGVGRELVVDGTLLPLGLDTLDSYSVSAFNDGIYYEIRPLNVENGRSFRITKAEKARLAVLRRLEESVGSKAGAFLYSMLFGDKSRLDKSVIKDFRLSGTAHVFAVSGLHIGVLSGAVIWILRRLKLKDKSVFFCVAAVLVAYAYLSSFSPSVMRASVMVLLMLLARALGRRNDNLSTLCLSAAALLLLKPFWLFDISFLLSFSAVFGIITLYSPLNRALKRVGRIGNAVALNISVNIGIMPFILYYFGTFSLLTLPANLVMIPLVSFVYILTLIHLFCCFLLPFIHIFGAVIKHLAEFCLDFAAQIAKVPGAVVTMDVPLILFAPYYAGVIALSDYALFNRRQKALSAASLFIVFAVCALLLAR